MKSRMPCKSDADYAHKPEEIKSRSMFTETCARSSARRQFKARQNNMPGKKKEAKQTIFGLAVKIIQGGHISGALAFPAPIPDFSFKSIRRPVRDSPMRRPALLRTLVPLFHVSFFLSSFYQLTYHANECKFSVRIPSPKVLSLNIFVLTSHFLSA